MIFHETGLSGCHLIEPQPVSDERGFFARTFCADEFASQGLDFRVVQGSVSYNRRRGTLRGLHYQASPAAEAKLVRCTRGQIWDVAADLRPDSATFARWFAVVLTAENHLAVLLPEGVAHGFITLEDHAEVAYQISMAFRPECARGVRWDDPTLQIRWPAAPSVISERDADLPWLDAVEPDAVRRRIANEPYP